MANISPLLSFFPDDRLVDTWEGGAHQRLPKWRLDWEDALRAGEPFAVPSSGRANAQAPSVPMDSMPQPFFPKPWGPAVPSGGTPVFPGFPQGYPTLPWNQVPMRPRTDVNASPEGLKNQNQGPRYTNDQLGLTNDTLAQQPSPAQVEVDEQVGGMDPRRGIQPRTDQGFGSYQPSAADFGEKQTKQQSPFSSDAGMWGILAAGLGILANNYGNYGQAGPAIGKGGMMGLNTFLGERQVQERNKFAQQELDQRNAQIQQTGRYQDAMIGQGDRRLGMEEGAYRQKEAQALATRNLAIQLAGNDPVQQGIAMGNAEKYIDFKLAQLKPDYKTRPVRKGTQAYDEYSIDGGKTWEKVPGSGPYDMKAASGASSIDLKIGQKQGEAFTGPIAKQVDESYSRATSAVESQRTIEGFRQRLNDPTLIAGAGANVRLAAAQVATLFGGEGADVESTRQVIQGLAELTVASRGMLKGQGPVTEYEQKTLEKARSGDISLTIPEMKALLNVFTRMNKAQYDSHGSVVNRLRKIKGSEDALEFYQPDPFPETAPEPSGQKPWQRKDLTK
jgi:hypothetical protein